MNVPDFSFSVTAQQAENGERASPSTKATGASVRGTSKYSVYKRLANLALVILAAAISINLWLLSNHHAQDWHDKQANQLGRSLSLHGALSMAEPLLAKDSDKIAFYLQVLASDPHVSNAALFDVNGRLLDSTSNDISLVAAFKLQQRIPLVFVQEVSHEGRTIGYLRLLLNEDQVMRYHDEYQTKIYEQMLVLMLLSGVGGLLLARAFYKFRYRHFRKMKREAAAKTNDQTPQRNLGL